MDSNGQMIWKSDKMDRADQLGNGGLNQRNGTGGNEDELVSETVKKVVRMALDYVQSVQKEIA